MPFCSQCGTKNLDDSRFCQSCGMPLAAVPPAAAAPVIQQPAPPPPQAVPPPPPPVTAYPPAQQVYQQAPPPPVPGYPVQQPYAPPVAPAQQPGMYPPPPGYAPQAMVKRKSPGVAAVLGFLLGGFGAQAFYNGQVKKGFAQLAVFWVAWLILAAVTSTPGQVVFNQMTGQFEQQPQLSPILMIFGLVYVIACAFDGYKVAEKINAGQPVNEFGCF